MSDVKKREVAEKYFLDGYNCAQAVALAFAEYAGMNDECVLKSVSGFGGGVGRMREVCGAISGMAFICGWIFGYSDANAVTEKKELYSVIQELCDRFKRKNGSIICRDLLGAKLSVVSSTPEARTPEYYKTRPCAKLVGDAAEILEEYLKEKGVSRESE